MIVLVLTYEGEYTDNPYEIIQSQMKRFDEDVLLGNYDQMGVACACNKFYGMECALVFASHA